MLCNAECVGKRSVTLVQMVVFHVRTEEEVPGSILGLEISNPKGPLSFLILPRKHSEVH
jgi:hypothetical protein